MCLNRFTEVVGLKRFAIYVFDYGAPAGFRIATKHPDRITAIISQNGNAYDYKRNIALYPTFQAYFRSRRSSPRGARTIRSSCRAARIQARHPRSS